jgi:SAM-dependent methyltransferase
MKLAGSVPERIFLLQADLNAMPFRPGSFHTALCMNVLHHFADAGGLVADLKRLLVYGGHLYLTSLVKGNRLIGDYYLNKLYRRGDFVQPRTGMELQNLLADSFGESVSYWMRGNMAHVAQERRGDVGRYAPNAPRLLCSSISKSLMLGASGVSAACHISCLTVKR